MMTMNDSKKILIVDDEVEICLLLSAIIQGHGYYTSYAHTISEGLRKFKEKDYDTVFLDLNLPDGVGFEFIPEAKKINDKSKFIIISAFDRNAERKKAASYGAVDFIGKPFNKETVIQALSQVTND